MPSSLAAALAASKQSGPAVAGEKKKNEPPRKSSLMNYNQKKGESKREEKDRQTKTKRPQKKQEKINTTRNNNKSNINHGNNPHQQKKTPDKSGKKSDDNVSAKPTNKRGEKKRGTAQTPVKTVDNADGLVFVCDIPSDSDDSDFNDECDGAFADGDCADEVDYACREEGECTSDEDGQDLDVVVITDGGEKDNTHNVSRKKGGRRGKGARADGKGETSRKDTSNDRNKSGGRDRNRGNHKQSRGGHGKDASGGRDFKSVNTAGGVRTDSRASANPAASTNTGLMPTPWSTRTQTANNNPGNRRDQHNRNNHHANAGRHSKDHTNRNNHKHAPSDNTPTVAPASSQINSNEKREATATLPKVEALSMKGRWADEDSSDDE